MPRPDELTRALAVAVQSLLFCFTVQPSSSTPLPASPKHKAPIDREIDSAFAARRAKRWKRSESHFESAIRLFEDSISGSASRRPAPADRRGPPAASPGSQAGRTSTESEIGDYFGYMGARQAVYTFACFSAALAGDERSAARYFDAVRGMRGPLWGRSYDETTVLIQRRFFAAAPRSHSPGYGKLLRYAGELLLDAGKPRGIGLIRRSTILSPNDPAGSARLASFYITHNSPARARREALSSLRLKPDQTSVLIDLSTAEWMLGHFRAAKTRARRVRALNASLPGPHATLAFVALQEGDNATALKEAEEGERLSGGHPFYETVLAACLFAAGDSRKAQGLMKTAWPNGHPTAKELRDWYFKGKPFSYALSSRPKSVDSN